jgi:chromosome segregation ATPase
MKQIEDLQGRILAAMDRIGTGVGALEQARSSAEAKAVAAADTSALEQALDEERVANAQLTERVKVLRGRLKELEEQAPAASTADASGDIAAMQAELELLRNEAANAPQAEALKQEVARLKAQMEGAANSAATDKESLEDRIEQLEAANAELTAQLAESGSVQETSTSETADGESGGTDEEVLQRLDTELQQLRLANEQLRTSNAALREANAEGLGDAGLINAAMAAEIDGLRAAQASDKAQVNAVLARLEPLLAAAPNLPEGEEI